MQTAEETRAYYRAHYQANKEQWRAKRMRYEAKIRGLKLNAKDKPCADCGRRWPAIVMEFDHKPGTEKLFEIGCGAARKWGWRRIAEEIAKCEVVCPTCHRIRTFRRLGLID